MKCENDKYLCEHFPLTFKDRRSNMQSTCMYWGFCCGDGWFDLIREAAEKIEPMLEKMPEGKRGRPTSMQVKEKYGGLRWYWGINKNEIRAIVDEVEKRSYKICETCGKLGNLRGNNWFYVSCDEHKDVNDPDILESDEDEE